ncbi:MAG TPA: hypothetical protein VMT19_07040 [Thermoanaerobaculaceae bacterium]|nr:hypothetical protein [Thermoanaerobaculaceae bacterium]
MRTLTIALSAAIVIAGCAHNAPSGVGARAEAASDEAGLAEALAGRTAGPPQECVAMADLGAQRSYGRGVIVFDGRTEDVVYVNRPPVACPGLDAGRALKSATTVTRLCRGDIVTVFDPVGGVGVGSCSLGQFVPYRRTR